MSNSDHQMSAAQIIDLLEMKGGGSYFGEPVTVLEHSLQAAHLARESGSGHPQIVAALLHDIGHLLHQDLEVAAEHGRDTRHEEIGQQMLVTHLPASVTEPIRLHVTAKRYLCFADPAYLAELSPSSLLSLRLQGGPMCAEEAVQFLEHPFAPQAIALRRWDDEAKIPGLSVAAAESYLSTLQSLWR